MLHRGSWKFNSPSAASIAVCPQSVKIAAVDADIRKIIRMIERAGQDHHNYEMISFSGKVIVTEIKLCKSYANLFSLYSRGEAKFTFGSAPNMNIQLSSGNQAGALGKGLWEYGRNLLTPKCRRKGVPGWRTSATGGKWRNGSVKSNPDHRYALMVKFLDCAPGESLDKGPYKVINKL